MTTTEMEQRLLQLSKEFRETRSPKVRQEYKRLHATWKRAKETT